MSDAEHTRRLARQHAETSRLLGVDFVPLKPVQLGPSDGGAMIEAKPSNALRSSVMKDREETERLMTELRARYEADAPHDSFVTDHHSIVWGDGDVCADLMFVGEAPGAEEDKQGKPFVGRSGQLLDKMITALGLSRPQVYIANVLKTRPPNNATPTQDEMEACRPYLLEQIAIVNPSAIVTLGRPAAQCLLSTNEAMGRLRGHWSSLEIATGALGTVSFPVMPTYHPAYVLRNYTADTRGKVWSDLLQAAEKLGLDIPTR
ncbi:MAG: uracil-DNA glycosylase [Planctomycetota bacterium]